MVIWAFVKCNRQVVHYMLHIHKLMFAQAQYVFFSIDCSVVSIGFLAYYLKSRTFLWGLIYKVDTKNVGGGRLDCTRNKEQQV